ncbi:MAG: SPFH domain-containing protein [Byssovorax sp.]
MLGILLVLGLTAVVVVGFVFYTLKNLLLVSSPSEALILSGGTHPIEGRTVGYRSIRGGRAVRIPLLESVDRLDISNVPVEISVKAAYSKGGIPLNVQGVAQIKLPSEEPRLANAVERFLGRSRAQIAQVARETLEGNVRGVLAQLTPEQVNQDKTEFARKLLEEGEHDMARMGLVLDMLKIQNVTDDANYLNSSGRIQGARVRMEASIVEAKTQAQASEQKADNWARAEMAKIDADLAIARQETDKRIKDALSRREAMIQEARGQVLAQIAQVKAEITRQKARALQVERQLEADIINPEDANRRMAEEQARGEAATIIETGRAEAEALKRLIEEYKKAGPSAKQVLTLQQLIPLVGDISGAARPAKIKRLSFLPRAGADSLAGKAIAAREHIRAATGVDITDLVKRLGPPAAPPAATPPKPTKSG